MRSVSAKLPVPRAAILIFSQCVPTEVANTDEIEAALSEFTRSFNNLDWPAFRSTFTEDATVFARQRPGEKAPKIFISNARARMLEPKPLPNPIPIPYATAVVSLTGKPLVDLTAVACVNREPLRVRVVVPTKVSKVFITADAESVAGGLGLMGLKIAGKIEKELEVNTGPVKVKSNPDCSGRRVVKIDADGNVIE